MTGNPTLRQELRNKARGGTTVSQIWNDDVHIVTPISPKAAPLFVPTAP